MGKKSLGLTLPIDLLEKLGWREKQKVVVKKIRGGLSIKDWQKWFMAKKLLGLWKIDFSKDLGSEAERIHDELQEKIPEEREEQKSKEIWLYLRKVYN